MNTPYHIEEFVKDVLPSSELSARDAFGHAAHKYIQDAFKKNAHPFPLYDAALQSHALTALREWVETTKEKAEHLVVLGTGGSSLGGQTLVDFTRNSNSVTFIDNIDPHTLSESIALCEDTSVHWLVISKSGGTLETVTQAALIAQTLGTNRARNAMSVITGGTKNPVRDLAEQYDIPTLEHPELGGRFTLFSVVALLPALWAGCDVDAVLQGGMDTYQALNTQSASHPAARGAALQTAIMNHCPIHVLMPYCDRLGRLADWHKQLWAESLGKDGHGSTPVRALGTVDQHSQLQLYLEGPEDKFFTLICVDNANQGPKITTTLQGTPWDMLNGKTIGDVMQASQSGTIASLQHHNKPLRVIHVPKLDAYTLGALAMHFMLETVLTAALLGINPYNQPAVEDGKQRTRDMLSAPGNAEVA